MSSYPAHTIISSTGIDPDGWRLWWREERHRCGTNWIPLSETVTAIMFRLAAASSRISASRLDHRRKVEDAYKRAIKPKGN